MVDEGSEPERRLEVDAVSSDGRLGIIAAFGAIWFVWGSTYLAIAWGVETIPPFLMIGVRCVTAGALMYGWARARGGARPRAADWRQAAVTGVLLFVTGQALLAWAETRLPSGVTALLIATEPLFVAVLPWLARRAPTPEASTGLALATGFVGVGALMLPGSGSFPLDPLAMGAVVLTALSWSVGMLRAAPPPGFSAVQSAGMQLLTGGVVLLALSLVSGEPAALPSEGPSVRSLAAVAYLIVFGSIVGYGAYVWLLGRVSAQMVSTHGYINPLVAVALGATLNEEPVTADMGVAAVLILGSVALLLRARAAPARPLVEEPMSSCAS
jgi:drug/metabolite transporter (DMT)-like permease